MKGFLLFITTAFLFVGIFFVLWSDISTTKSRNKTKTARVDLNPYSGNKGLTMREIDSLTAVYNYSFTKYNDPAYLKITEQQKES